MRLTIHKRILQDALSRVDEAVNHSHDIPVYSGIYFEASEQGITLVGTDGPLMIEETIPPDQFTLDGVGRIVLPAKMVMEIIKRMPDGEVKIGADALTASFSAGPASMELSCMEPEEFTLYPIPDGQGIEVTGEVLGNLIRQTTFCTSDKKNESRPILYGAYVKSDDEGLSFFAGDGGRVGTARELMDTEERVAAIVHRKHLDSIRKLFKPTDTIRILVTGRQAYFIGDRIRVAANQINGTYPPVDTVFNGEDLYAASLKREDLINSVERARLTADSETIFLKYDGRQIEIRSHSQVGKTQEVLEPFKFKGEAGRRAFNGKFVSEALNAITGDWVKMRFTNGLGNPLILADESSDKSLYFIASQIIRGGA